LSGARFERPHAALAQSYSALVREFAAQGEDPIPFPLSFAHDNFDAFLAKLAACERGEQVPEGFVPHTTFWLVDEADQVVAVSNLRHRLTERLRIEGGHIGYGVRPSARRRGHATELLRQTLGAARALGIAEALVTCAKANAGSVATIRRCGGRLQSEAFVAERGEVVQRYLIAT
jgi:predicted acetyltransferase